ncbi:MAG: nucleotide exchange factor GrpE [Blastocatellia bacterium]|nr:nucleotide exchange factor GrpE [Blastocatellia bacterium]
MIEDEAENAELSSPVPQDSLDDSMRSLRLRRFEGGGYAPIRGPEPFPEDEPEEEVEEEEDEEEDDEAGAEIARAIESLGQEVRRLGRELFREGRATERNQEMFGEAIEEVRRLGATVALIPAQHAEALASTKFEAKAEVCRELLRMADTSAASLAAADELLARLRPRADRPAEGLAFRFAAARELRDALTESLAAMRQWREGQKLLADRLQAILQAAGVREIDALGRVFDPALHRAVSAAERAEAPAGTIVGVESKGYTLEGRILRYAEVTVAR